MWSVAQGALVYGWFFYRCTHSARTSFGVSPTAPCAPGCTRPSASTCLATTRRSRPRSAGWRASSFGDYLARRRSLPGQHRTGDRPRDPRRGRSRCDRALPPHRLRLPLLLARRERAPAGAPRRDRRQRRDTLKNGPQRGESTSLQRSQLADVAAALESPDGRWRYVKRTPDGPWWVSELRHGSYVEIDEPARTLRDARELGDGREDGHTPTDTGALPHVRSCRTSAKRPSTERGGEDLRRSRLAARIRPENARRPRRRGHAPSRARG